MHIDNRAQQQVVVWHGSVATIRYMPQQQATRYKTQESLRRELWWYKEIKEIERRLEKLCGWNSNLLEQLRAVQREHPNLNPLENENGVRK